MLLTDVPGHIIISGLTAAGKTTHARLISQEFGLQYVSASQTMLKLDGQTIKQPLDFWVSGEGFRVAQSIPWRKVDQELCHLEASHNQMVFDCLSLPWLHSRQGLVIWLESSLPSRVMKAVVSHKGQCALPLPEVKERIKKKDRFARHQILEQYGVDIFKDRTPFNLIVDVSSFIKAPTEAAADRGIRQTHKIISTVVGWYLHEDRSCWRRLQVYLARYGSQVIQRYPQRPMVTAAFGVASTLN